MAPRPPWETYNLPPWARTPAPGPSHWEGLNQQLAAGGMVDGVPMRAASSPVGDFNIPTSGGDFNSPGPSNPDKPDNPPTTDPGSFIINQAKKYPNGAQPGPMPPGWTGPAFGPKGLLPYGQLPPPRQQGQPGPYTPQAPNTGIMPMQSPGILGTNQYGVDQGNYNLPGFQYTSGAAINNQQAALQGGGAGSPQAQTEGQQGMLSNALFNQMNGTGGPSVAQQQLSQSTQSNIANQFALAQANGNDAGALRNISNNVGNLNQQAAGQGSLLRAQEVANAQGQLGSVLSGERGQDQSQFQMDQNAALGWGNQNLQAEEAQQQGQENAAGAQQNAYQTAAAEQMGLAGGVAGGGSAAAQTILSSLLKSAPASAPGAKTPSTDNATNGSNDGGGNNSDNTPDTQPDSPVDNGGTYNWTPPSYDYTGGAIKGDATVAGDSPRNDTVKAMLSPGEVVLPRSVTQAEDAPDKAKAFLDAIKKGKGPKPTFGDVLMSHRKMNDRINQLEAYCRGGMVR